MLNERWIFSLIFSAIIFSVLPSSAGIYVSPGYADADSYVKLSFRVTDGCNGSPTVKIVISIPEGIQTVIPKAHPSWRISTKKSKAADESLTEVTWGDGNLADGLMEEFEMLVKLPYKPGEDFLFPVTQTCENTVIRWNGGSKSKYPAPELSLHRKRGVI